MRVGGALALVACAGASDVPADVAGPTRRPIADFLAPPSGIRVVPAVELLPENGLVLHVIADEPVVLAGQVFAIYRMDGDSATEVRTALPRWNWDEARRIVRLEPVGLQRGAPYLLVGEGLVTDSGRSIPPFAKPFRVIGPDLEAPDGRGLRVLGDPRPGSAVALRIPFPEPIREDATAKVAALAGGGPWPGAWTLSQDQRDLVFTPSQPWPDAPVVVSVGGGIHDLAFNELIHRPTDMLVPQVRVR